MALSASSSGVPSQLPAGSPSETQPLPAPEPGRAQPRAGGGVCEGPGEEELLRVSGGHTLGAQTVTSC